MFNNITDESQIDFLRSFHHILSESFGRKNYLESIKRFRREKTRKVSSIQPHFLSKQKMKKGAGNPFVEYK